MTSPVCPHAAASGASVKAQKDISMQRSRWRGIYFARWLAALFILSCAASLFPHFQDVRPASAQDTPAGNEKRVLLRFLTSSDYPPFNYYDDEGVLVGLNIDLARAVCLDLSLACDIRVRPWPELLKGLKAGETDAVIAGHAITAQLATNFEFSDRYFYTPGRFATARTSALRNITPDSLVGLRIGVTKGSAHERFLTTFFRDSRIVPFDSNDAAREALRDGKVDALFGDSVGLAFWLNGTLSRRCCEFRGGSYFEPRFFGNGLSIVINKSDPKLKLLINDALARVKQSGRLEELVQRYFPIRAY